MTITVGTDVYVSVADADAYWLARNNDTWSDAEDEDKEKALLEATAYIDGAYSFIGYPVLANILAWPRDGVVILKGNFYGRAYNNTTIPPQVKAACCELALDALSQRLVETLDRGGAIKTETIDVITTEYMDWAPSGRTFKFASMILQPLTTGSGGVKSLVRS